MADLQSISTRLENLSEELRPSPDTRHIAEVLDGIANDLVTIREGPFKHYPGWSQDSRPAPQIHYRVNVSGMKRTPDATVTMDGDIRDVDLIYFWAIQDEFQAEVDERYPLPAKEG